MSLLEDFVLSPPGTESPPHLVFVQHGSHGHFSDMQLLADTLQQQCGFRIVSSTTAPRDGVQWPRFVVFHTPVTEGFTTDWGLAYCCDRAITDLLPALQSFTDFWDSTEYVRFSIIGHSFGGIIARELIYRIRTSPVSGRLRFTCFVTIATPHLGVRDLSAPLYYGGVALGAMFSSAYHELLLMGEDGGPLCTALIDDDHLSALAAFERRYLIANTRKDILVSFRAASLMLLEDVRIDPEAEGAMLTAHTAKPITLWRGDILSSASVDVMPVFESSSSNTIIVSPPWTADHSSLEFGVARKLRESMDFVVVPVVHRDAWLPLAHTAVVSFGKFSSFRRLMDDVSYSIAGLIASGGAQWPSVKP